MSHKELLIQARDALTDKIDGTGFSTSDEFSDHVLKVMK